MVLPRVGLSVIKRTCIFCTQGVLFVVTAMWLMTRPLIALALLLTPFPTSVLNSSKSAKNFCAQNREYVNFSDVFPILLYHIQGYAKRTQTAATMSVVLNRISEEERDK